MNNSTTAAMYVIVWNMFQHMLNDTNFTTDDYKRRRIRWLPAKRHQFELK